MLRSLPSASELLESPPLKSLVDRVNRNVVVSGVRRFLDEMRLQVQSAAANARVPTASELAERIADWIVTKEGALLRPVINATGIILHEQLGRTPLAEEAVQAIADSARGYCNLEINLADSAAVAREAAIEPLLARLTGAESATIVNTSAGAALLALAALSAGKEAIVARGQVIDSGDGHALPEIARTSHAILREVGSANRARGSDFAAAIGPNAAVLWRTSSSDFARVGSVEEVPLAEMTALARQHNLTLVDDLRSAALVDLTPYGLQGLPMVNASVQAGADLVLFCGDKLVGGPECGIIVGRRKLIQELARHPLARALRASKLTLAALGATLQLYESLELAQRSIPLLSLISTPLENLQNRAARLAPQLMAAGKVEVEIVPEQTYLAGAKVPGQALPTICLHVKPHEGSCEALAAALRRGAPAVLCRLEAGKLLLDLRSVPPRDDARLVTAFEVLRKSTSTGDAAPPTEPVIHIQM